MRMYKTGDPCPCCGQPIPYRDTECLRLFSILVHLLDISPDDEQEENVSESDTSLEDADLDAH